MSLTELTASINITKPVKKRKLLNDSYHRLLRDAHHKRPKNAQKHAKTMKTRKEWMRKNRQALLKRAQFVRKWHSTHKASLEASSHSPPASPSNVDGAFSVGPIQFDNRNGLGNTPNGSEISYFGCVAFMPASKFIALSLPSSDVQQRADRVRPLIEEGKPIACPFLILTFDGEPSEVPPEGFRVRSHEGRARVTAIQEITGKRDFVIPVQLFFGSYRAKHLTPEILLTLKEGIVKESKVGLVNPDITKFFWNGKEV